MNSFESPSSAGTAAKFLLAATKAKRNHHHEKDNINYIKAISTSVWFGQGKSCCAASVL